MTIAIIVYYTFHEKCFCVYIASGIINIARVTSHNNNYKKSIVKAINLMADCDELWLQHTADCIVCIV